MSYDKLDSSAQTLLQILCFLHYEGITEEIFKRASLCDLEKLNDLDLEIQVVKLLSNVGKQDSKWNSLLFQELIGDNKSYSLIEFDDQNQLYSMHPLVQHWCAWSLGQKQNDIQKCVLSIIGLSISLTVNSDDYKYQHVVLQHVSSAIDGFKSEDINVFILEIIA